MADDIVGGIFVNFIIRGIRWVFFDGGIDVIYGLIGR